MFKIKTRITDDIEELRVSTPQFFDKELNNVSGFVEVIIGHHKIGYCHEKPMQIGEWGGEWVNWWLEKFLLCANNIQKTKYIAVLKPETANRWIEFELVDDILTVNLAQGELNTENKLFISEKHMSFIYDDPVGVRINLYDFLHEVNDAVNRFIDDLKAINPKLVKTKMANNLLANSCGLQNVFLSIKKCSEY